MGDGDAPLVPDGMSGLRAVDQGWQLPTAAQQDPDERGLC
jgi:hypothetical protein